jgi:hypothetical protein
MFTGPASAGTEQNAENAANPSAIHSPFIAILLSMSEWQC